MEWNSPLPLLANHNDDIRQLIERGYALALDGSYLVVRDVSYLNEQGDLKFGAIVSKLDFIDQNHVRPVDHQIFFCGSHPCELNGSRIPNLGGGETSLALSNEDLKVERVFSNRPQNGFTDHFDKIENYVMLFSGPAMEKYQTSANPYTFKQYESYTDSVFKFWDTLTSRAEIGDLTRTIKDDVVAIIGLGGTGSYILDYLSKSPVKEIRGFDFDPFHIHNAYRSPGRVDDKEFGKSKAEVYQNRYANFRQGLNLQPKFIGADSVDDLNGVTFAFVSVDKGYSRANIFNLLAKMGIPFIDVGMGLNRDKGTIGGMLRTTYYPAESAQTIIDKRLAPMADYADDVYKTNIQIAELNALNASMAVIKYKQIRGFYNDDTKLYHTLFGVDDLRNLGEYEI
jgi:hypothetical protein